MLILCRRVFSYACMLDLVVLDLAFICNSLVCIFVFFCDVSLDHFGFVFSNFVLSGLVSQYQAKRSAGKNVSEMSYFVSSRT